MEIKVCPKCGSELDTGFNCPKCGYKRYEVAVSKTELTIADMWEWLGKNYSLTLEHRDGQNDRLEIAHGFWNFIAEENGFENCVRTAYTEAKKKEEQNA